MRRVYLPLDYITSCEDAFSNDGGDKNKNTRLAGALYQVINNDLTKTQKSYIILYYKYKMKPKQIAERYNVNPSTVSRTIARAKKNIFRLLKYI